MPEGTGGYAKAWFIRIRPKYRDNDDTGILVHEETHVWQFWTGGLIIHMLRYTWSKSYRLKCEVEAYKEQLKWYPANTELERYRDMYAGFISDPDPVKGYGLTITKEEALRLLNT